MRTKCLVTGIFLGLIGLAFACEPQRQSLQGTWSAVAAQRDSEPDPNIVGHQLVFTDTRFEIA